MSVHTKHCDCMACLTVPSTPPVPSRYRVPVSTAVSVAPDPWGQGPDDKPSAYTFRPAEPDERDDPNSYPMAVSRGDGLRPLYAAALAYRRAWDSPHPFAADAVDALNVAMSALCAAALAVTKVKP